MLGVIISAITVIMLGYLMVGFAGYLAFPTTVEGNVLKSFPEKSILIQVWPPQLPFAVPFHSNCMRMASMLFVHAMHYDCCPFPVVAIASSFLLHCHLLSWDFGKAPNRICCSLPAFLRSWQYFPYSSAQCRPGRD